MTGNVPNIAGRVMTVRGPIDPGQLGVTLMHEHLFITTNKTYRPDDNTPATDWHPWEQNVTMDNWFVADERMTTGRK